MTLPNSKYDHKSVLVGSHVPKGKRHFSEQLAASPTHIQTSFNSVYMPIVCICLYITDDIICYYKIIYNVI